jgi:hypothetical protein
MLNDSLPCQILSLQAWYYRKSKEIWCRGIEDPKGEKKHSLARYKQEEQVMCQLDS